MKNPKKPEASHVRGLCVRCGERPQRRLSRTKQGMSLYSALCGRCAKAQFGRDKFKLFKGPRCDACGFEPVNLCQLDVDHINCDRSDNRPENLQTLCANCHRLKTLKDHDAGLINSGIKSSR